MFAAAADWHARAVCRDADPDLFFALAGQRAAIADAKRVCARCPVRADCLDQALADETLEGVWGGTTDRERMAVRLRARIAETRRRDVPA
ncbi:WhiB family transcriptional regulator [Actinomadura atramentaria]|uniref:WhiB family transcriptional regulator n=1 Tax=Actinomadura atramentaria TaxID=1990 RepID=UPI000363DE50|nr:WhiB family transcriptional regulator [Actinomadura atramentaria]